MKEFGNDYMANAKCCSDYKSVEKVFYGKLIERIRSH